MYPVQRHVPMGVPPPPGFSCCLADSNCRLEDRASYRSYLFISLRFSYFGASLCHATKTKTTKTKTEQRAFGACRLLAFSTLFVQFVADVPYCSAVLFWIISCIRICWSVCYWSIKLPFLSKRLKDCGLCFISTA